MRLSSVAPPDELHLDDEVADDEAKDGKEKEGDAEDAPAEVIIDVTGLAGRLVALLLRPRHARRGLAGHVDQV